MALEVWIVPLVCQGENGILSLLFLIVQTIRACSHLGPPSIFPQLYFSWLNVLGSYYISSKDTEKINWVFLCDFPVRMRKKSPSSQKQSLRISVTFTGGLSNRKAEASICWVRIRALVFPSAVSLIYLSPRQCQYAQHYSNTTKGGS